MKLLLVLVASMTILACGAEQTTSQAADSPDSATPDTKNMDVLICKSPEKIKGWDGWHTDDYLKYTAYIESETELHKAVINGAYGTDMRSLIADVDADNKFSRRRFSVLEDAWCWFKLLVPKGYSELVGNFKGTVQYTCEDYNGYEYIDLGCFIKRR